MAFSLRLTGVSWKDGAARATTISANVPGVKIADDPRFRNLSEGPGYLDYYAVLSKDETLEIVKTGEWLVDSRMKLDAGSPARASYEAMLRAISESDLVIAHNYEWESGFGD